MQPFCFGKPEKGDNTASWLCTDVYLKYLLDRLRLQLGCCLIRLESEKRRRRFLETITMLSLEFVVVDVFV